MIVFRSRLPANRRHQNRILYRKKMDNDQAVGAGTLEGLLLHEKRPFPGHGGFLHPANRRRVGIFPASVEALTPLT